MTKAELVDEVSRISDLTRKHSEVIVDAVFTSIVEALQLDPARVMVNCSHTHSGPVTSGEDRDKPGGEMIPPYIDKIREGVLRAVRRALETEAPGTLTWATGRCDLAGNRDLHDPSRERWPN